VLFSAVQQTKSGLDRLAVDLPRSRSIRHKHTHTHTWRESPEAVISSSQRPLPTQIITNTKNERYIISGIQSRGSNNQAASEPCVDCKASGIGTFYCLLYLI